MIGMENGSLAVSVLDPVEDANRLGTRYCTGGFIFQILAPGHGALLAGPTYPDSYNLFDGQGIPDSFKLHLPIRDGRELGIGIGIIDVARNEPLERCAWRTTEGPGRLTFQTEQEAEGYGLSLERSLHLAGRTLRSATRLANTGTLPLPLQWFPHPFFPLFEGGECCKFLSSVILPDNPGYEIAPSGFLRMKGLPPVGKGYFQLVEHGPEPMRVIQKHPLLGIVAATCDYVPIRLPVWGNRNTFSFEPYYERVISPGEEARWSVTYDF